MDRRLDGGGRGIVILSDRSTREKES